MQVLSENKFLPISFEIDVQKTKNTRSLIVGEFVTELNKSAGTKYKVGEIWKTVGKVKASFIGYKLSHLNEAELWYFLSLCRQSRSGFSKCFYGALKKK